MVNTSKEEIIRARSPLRLGLAGGGTDVSPYSDMFGGAVLNATINLFAYVSLVPRYDGKLIFHAVDRAERLEVEATEHVAVDGHLDLLKGVYNRVVKDFSRRPLSCELSTFVDAPAGSGLGTSSTLAVTVLGAFAEWLGLPLGEYDMAHLAWDIERNDLNFAGGKQDQYAATFGGFNFMEFFANDKVIVNPLRIKQDYIGELEFNIVLYYTGTSRLSSTIIEAQAHNVEEGKAVSIEAMHRLKEQSVLMKEVILKGELQAIGEILDFGWRFKKQMADNITDQRIDEIYEAAVEAGATGGKISGAGGGGFMMLYCPGNTRYSVIERLTLFGGKVRRFQFVKHGSQSWRV